MQLLQNIKHTAVLTAGFIALILVYLVGNLLAILPYGKGFILSFFYYLTNAPLQPDVLWKTMLKPPMMKTLWRMWCLDTNRGTRTGERFPEAHLIDAKSHEITQLSTLVRRGRPLVLNFGSCSWPPFMALLQKFLKLSQRFSDVADFAIVYIEEAHALDEWAFDVSPAKSVCWQNLSVVPVLCI